MDDAQIRSVPTHVHTNLFTVTVYSASLRAEDLLTFKLIESRDFSRKQKFQLKEEITEIKKEYGFLLKWSLRHVLINVD